MTAHCRRCAAGAALAWLVASTVAAHADVGRRDFADTILFDSPDVDDQLTLPTIAYHRFGAEGGPGPVHETDFSFEFEKRITARLGVSAEYGWSIFRTEHDKTRTGFENLEIGAKYEVYVDPKHEFIVSLALLRDFGRTGTAHTGAEQTGITTPVAYFGKGFGDVPIPYLKPLASTGAFGYAIADKSLKIVAPPAGAAEAVFNTGTENRWVGGLSLQYSLAYFDAEVHHLNLPDWAINFTPLIELAWSSPATAPSSEGTKWVLAPGVTWTNQRFGFGIEALIPLNRASGRNVGVIGQFRMALGNIAPRLNKPVFPLRVD